MLSWMQLARKIEGVSRTSEKARLFAEALRLAEQVARARATGAARVHDDLLRSARSAQVALPGALDPRRADVIVAGAIVLDTILQRLDATTLTLCELALREGLILDYIHRNRRHVSHVDRIPDVRRRSTLELAERCNYAPDHAQQIARTALALFDATRGMHGLTDRERPTILIFLTDGLATEGVTDTDRILASVKASAAWQQWASFKARARGLFQRIRALFWRN